MARAAPALLPGRTRKVKNSGTPRCTTSSKISGRLSVVSCHDLIWSTAGLRSRDVSFDLFKIGADNSADKVARAIINVYLRNGANIELLRHGCSRPDNVDLAQRYLRIGMRHLLQAR